ncbi:MAG: lipase family protein, partial [Gemmatimonadaceae bacterium]
MVCSTKLFGDGGGLDVVECPKCRSTTPTGHEKLLRIQLEQYKNNLAYPKIAAGRAIGYAAGIYDLSTHNTRIDTSAIERKLEEHYGASGGAEHTSLKSISGRSAAGATDTRAGLVIYKVTGKNYKLGGPKGQEWSIVYVVFRGSRGEKKGEANPMGAGWGATATGQVVNLDWRTNFNTRQDTPPWHTGVKVHAGFLEIYSSVRAEIHATIKAYLEKDAHSAVIVTGHSLGAALATVCAHDLECAGVCKPVCMPFCSPRVGNLAFARDYNSRIADDTTVMWSEVDGVSFNRSFVFVQSNDPVTWGGEHGFQHAMSAKSGVQVA